MQAQCFICPECNYDHNHLGVGGINCLKRQLESKDDRIKELEAEIEEARQRLLIEQDNCEHEEEMKQGDGRVYGVCKKCLKELY